MSRKLGLTFAAGLAGSAGVYLALSGHAPVSTPAYAAETKNACSSLVTFRPSINTTIEKAEVISGSPAHPWTAPTSIIASSGTPTVPASFCRVAGYIQPTPQSHINFEVWLPAEKSQWNQKFLGTADGGSTGAINYRFMTNALVRGYATMGHDNGHVSKTTFEETWAFDPKTRSVKTELIKDFGFRAQHVATVVSKEVATKYYGSDLRHSYYFGCSQGGHHGMMEVQRFPQDYDGIISGAHGGDWLGMMSSEAYGAINVLKTGKLTAAQIGALHNSVLAACDGLDGVRDGMIQDPRLCHYDPAPLQCGPKNIDKGSCLSPAQVGAVKAIFAGPHDTSGHAVSPGYAIGSEALWNTALSPMGDPIDGSFYDFFRLLLKGDPNYDIKNLDFSTDIAAGRKKYSETFDAINPDLSAFRARGGKLIMYHGWSDPLINAYNSTNYFDQAKAKMGDNSLKQTVRLFMVPAMGHCTGGPIGDIDWLTALENWVEKGVAPDATSPNSTIIGSGMAADGVKRTRPICPYPMTQKYKGQGDINKAENFVCRAG